MWGRRFSKRRVMATQLCRSGSDSFFCSRSHIHPKTELLARQPDIITARGCVSLQISRSRGRWREGFF